MLKSQGSNPSSMSDLLRKAFSENLTHCKLSSATIIYRLLSIYILLHIATRGQNIKCGQDLCLVTWTPIGWKRSPCSNSLPAAESTLSLKEIICSYLLTYVGCCIIRRRWTSILWITSCGCSLCAEGAVAGMWWEMGWWAAGRCCGIGAAALANGWGGGGGGTGWEEVCEDMEGWKGCTGWGMM